MSTAKSLQKAAIIDITASKIRVKHPDISRNQTTQIASPFSAAGTALTVLDNNGFADDDWMIMGRIGDEKTEEVDVNGAPTRGTALTVTNTTKFAHEYTAPITKIFERQIKIYGSASDGVTGTVIATVSIEWSKQYTEYSLKTTDTAYAYYYATYYDGTTEGAKSDYIPSTGLPGATVFKVIQSALDNTRAEYGQKITLEELIRAADDCQTKISQFIYQDPRSNKYTPVDWGHEIDEDKTTLSISENQNRYSVSALNLKYTATRSIINLRIGTGGPLDKISPTEMDEELQDKAYTEVATQAEIGDITLVVDSNVEFEDAGSLYIGSEIITYTGKSGSTTFTGIPTSGTGSITAQHLVDAPVWQNVAPDQPTKFTIFDGYLIFNCPPSSDYASLPIKAKFYKKMTAHTEASDPIVIPFSNVYQSFIGARIEQIRGNTDQALLLMDEFNKSILANAQYKDTIPKAKKVYKKYAI